MGEGSSQSQVVQSLIDLVNTIALKGDFIKSHKKECAALSRRVKLLVPLFEELRESRQRIPQTVLPCFYALEDALQSANKLLQMCHSGSKLYLVSLSSFIPPPHISPFCPVFCFAKLGLPTF
jgi:hypothetical protein